MSYSCYMIYATWYMIYTTCICHLLVVWYMLHVFVIHLLYDIRWMHMSYSCCMIYATCMYHISVIWCMLHACIVYLLLAYIIYLCYMIYATCVYHLFVIWYMLQWLHSSVVECLQRTNKYLFYIYNSSKDNTSYFSISYLNPSLLLSGHTICSTLIGQSILQTWAQDTFKT